MISALMAGLLPACLSALLDDPQFYYLWVALAAVAGGVLWFGGGRPGRLRGLAVGTAFAGVFITVVGGLAAATSASNTIESWGTAVFFLVVAVAGVVLVHLALCVLMGVLILSPLGRTVRTQRFRRVAAVVVVLVVVAVSWLTLSTIRDGKAVTTVRCAMDDAGGSATDSRLCPPGQRVLGLDEHVDYDLDGLVARLLVVGYAAAAVIATPSYSERPPDSQPHPDRNGPLSVHGFEPWD